MANPTRLTTRVTTAAPTAAMINAVINCARSESKPIRTSAWSLDWTVCEYTDTRTMIAATTTPTGSQAYLSNLRPGRSRERMARIARSLGRRTPGSSTSAGRLSSETGSAATLEAESGSVGSGLCREALDWTAFAGGASTAA